MTYETCVTIVLTALCALLAALGLGIGALAIWGYKGIVEAVTQKATENAEKALAAKMQEYPAAAQMLEDSRRLNEALKAAERLRDQMVNGASNPLGQASHEAQTELVENPTGSIAADYPSVLEVDTNVDNS